MPAATGSIHPGMRKHSPHVLRVCLLVTAVLVVLVLSLQQSLVAAPPSKISTIHNPDAHAATASPEALPPASPPTTQPSAAMCETGHVAGATNSPLTGTFLDYFTNYGLYMARTHCVIAATGEPDWPWIIALLVLTTTVIAGYLRIFFFWRRAYLDEAPGDRNKKLMDLAYIFLWCAVCGYAMSLLSFVWPGYRLLAIFLAALNFFTWRFAATLGEFRLSLSAKRLERQLRETLGQQNHELQRLVEARTRELTENNERLRSSELRFNQMVANVPGMVYQVTRNLDGTYEYQYVSHGVEEIFGVTEAEALADAEAVYSRVHPDEIDAYNAACEATLPGVKPWRWEGRIVTKSGDVRWVRDEAVGIRLEDGRIRWDGIISDITASHKAAEELEAARDAANAASRAKSEFLAKISHEIRTPLGGITGFSEMLLREPNAPEQERIVWANTIRRSASHLLNLINDVLDVSKIEAGKMEFESIACSPHELISEVASVMRVPAGEKGLALFVQYRTAIPETIQCDPTRFKQVLLNLLNNAIKFTEAGNIRIVVDLAADAVTNHGKMIVHVSDTGIGMSPEQTARLFQPFMQGDNSMTRRFGGTGLGLTISRYICEQLGGSLTVSSQPGVGSVFSASISAGSLEGAKMIAASASEVTLPAGKAEAAAPAAAPSMRKRLAGARILVADDGETNRQLLSLILGRAGAHVVLASNGQEAIDRLNADGPFHVVLMDMQMPVMDGYTAVAELRRKGVRTPIFALTAHAMNGDRERCIGAGCDDYLTKPIETERLLEALELACSASQPETAQRPSPRSTASVPDPAVKPHNDSAGPIRSRLPADGEFQSIAKSFVFSVDGRITTLRQAVAMQDEAAVVAEAHKLKGAGGMAGYPEIAEVALRVEQAAIGKQLEDIAADLNALESLVVRCKQGFQAD